jgi:hypothetical protein
VLDVINIDSEFGRNARQFWLRLVANFAGNSRATQESWSARDLTRVLEYLNFRNFEPVIEKAKEACVKSGHAVADHFAEMCNMVDIGSGAQREVEDWTLSRYACYLVIQNADRANRSWRWGKVILQCKRGVRKLLTTRR